VGGGDVAGAGAVGGGQDRGRAGRVAAAVTHQEQVADDATDHLPAEGVGAQPDLDQAVEAADAEGAQPPGGRGPRPAAAEGGEVVLADEGAGGLAHA